MNNEFLFTCMLTHKKILCLHIQIYSDLFKKCITNHDKGDNRKVRAEQSDSDDDIGPLPMVQPEDYAENKEVLYIHVTVWKCSTLFLFICILI